MNEIKKLNKQLEQFFEDLEPEQITEEMLWEMTNLQPSRTGLPVAIYISGKKGSHGPRIKFMIEPCKDKNGQQDVDRNLLAELTVSNNPKIISAKKVKLSTQDITKLKNWVINNKDILIDLWKNKIDEVEAVYRLFPRS